MNIQNYYQLQIPQHQIEDNDEVLHPLDDNLIKDYVHNNDMCDTGTSDFDYDVIDINDIVECPPEVLSALPSIKYCKEIISLFRMSVAEIMKKVRVV